jgi:hypothetical protein
MQTGSSGTLIGWISGQTTFVPLWEQMEGAWLRTLEWQFCTLLEKKLTNSVIDILSLKKYFDLDLLLTNFV